MPTIRRERVIAFVAGLVLCTAMSGSMSLISKHDGVLDRMDTVSRASDEMTSNTIISGSMRVSQTVGSNATSVGEDTINIVGQNLTEGSMFANKNETAELPVSEAMVIGPVGDNGIAVAILTMASAVACALSIVAVIALFRNRDNTSEISGDFSGNEVYSVEESSGTSGISMEDGDESDEYEVVYEKKRRNRRQRKVNGTRFVDRIVRDDIDDITPEEAV